MVATVSARALKGRVAFGSLAKDGNSPYREPIAGRERDHGRDHRTGKRTPRLRWSDAPLVKLAEGGLVFLLAVHLLGGLRLLAVENLAWHDGQKRLAMIAGATATVAALAYLAVVF